jgi:hypothetical protein
MPEQNEQELTWDDLGAKHEIITLRVKGLKRPIRYFSSLPMDEALAINAKHAEDLKRGNRDGFIVDILRAVMIEPTLNTEQSARAALKSNFALLNRIVDDVSTFKEASEELPKD